MSQARWAVASLVVVTVSTGLGIAVIHNNQVEERKVRAPEYSVGQLGNS